MPTYIAQGRFTREAVEGMTTTPEDRTGPVALLFESLGARLLGWYLTTGEYDWLLIVDASGHDVVVAAAAAATAGGGVSDIKTFAAFSGEEARTIFERAGGAAGGFRSAGL